MVRTDLPGGNLWHGVLAAPLAVPAFVNGYGWVSTTHAVQCYARRRAGGQLSYYPLVYLPDRRPRCAGSTPASRTSRAALGPRPLATFFRVVLPPISPAVLGGALLVGLHLLARVRRAAAAQLPDADHRDPRAVPLAFNGPAATLLAAVLVVLLPAAAAASSCWPRGRRRTPGSAPGAAGRRPGPPSAGGLAACWPRSPALAVLALGVPLG